jgi:glycerol-3-phosphate acyltransferase PlsY
MTAILAHCFSPWLRFRGGKGVATALGVYLVMAPLYTLGAGLLFLVVLAATRVPALGSLAGALFMAIALALRSCTAYAIFGAGVFVLVVFTHRGNLARLYAVYRGRAPRP